MIGTVVVHGLRLDHRNRQLGMICAAFIIVTCLRDIPLANSDGVLGMGSVSNTALILHIKTFGTKPSV